DGMMGRDEDPRPKLAELVHRVLPGPFGLLRWRGCRDRLGAIYPRAGARRYGSGAGIPERHLGTSGTARAGDVVPDSAWPARRICSVSYEVSFPFRPWTGGARMLSV